MSDYIVTTSKLQGEIFIPPSKSQTLRAILFGSLAKGTTTIHSPLNSPDTQSMIKAFRSFGIEISQTPHKISIQGSQGILGTADDVIDAGNSGIVLRFVSAAAALSEHPVVITGDHSLRRQRPIGPLIDGLIQLGVKAVSTKGDGFAPVIIEGPIKKGKASISGEDSQPISGLLIASALAKGSVELHVKNPGEKPWVQLTLDWLKRLGLEFQNQNYEHYFVKGNQSIKGFTYSVPGDFSTAAFPIVAALITRSKATIKNLDFTDSQGDKKFIEVVKNMGGDISIDHEKKEIHIGNNSNLKGIEIDVNDMIDSIAALAVLGCFSEGTTIIRNAAVARTKECDRIHAATVELTKMGAQIEEKEDGLVISNSMLRGAQTLDSHRDHRVAMALCVAAMGAVGKSKIQGIECIQKTYSKFLDDFRSLGANMEVVL
jgi:3-phosphoshikimate 1-carboxyvinyltransferase